MSERPRRRRNEPSALHSTVLGAGHDAQSTARWSACLNGLQVDVDPFKGEIQAICRHAQAGA